jgi:hypothetical protein
LKKKNYFDLYKLESKTQISLENIWTQILRIF